MNCKIKLLEILESLQRGLKDRLREWLTYRYCCKVGRGSTASPEAMRPTLRTPDRARSGNPGVFAVITMDIGQWEGNARCRSPRR